MLGGRGRGAAAQKRREALHCIWRENKITLSLPTNTVRWQSLPKSETHNTTPPKHFLFQKHPRSVFRQGGVGDREGVREGQGFREGEGVFFSARVLANPHVRGEPIERRRRAGKGRRVSRGELDGVECGEIWRAGAAPGRAHGAGDGRVKVCLLLGIYNYGVH